MSRKTVYAIAAAAMVSMLIGCSTTAGPSGSSGQQQQQATATSQPQATATSQPQATATSQPQQASAVEARSVLTNVQVGTEFGATFAAGKQNTEMNLDALSSTRCSFESQLADGSPWTVSIIVDNYPTDTAAKGKMTDNRKTTSYTGDPQWAVTEMPGVGDDAVIQNLLTLGNTQENLVVRKGSVIYHFQDTIITGIADSAAARSHLVKLAHLVVG
jgi:hypothetical protein